jgi:hypothetical protein
LFQIDSEGLTAKKQRMNENMTPTSGIRHYLIAQGFSDQYLLPDNIIPVYLAKYNLKPFISDKDALEIIRQNPAITQAEQNKINDINKH